MFIRQLTDSCEFHTGVNVEKVFLLLRIEY